MKNKLNCVLLIDDDEATNYFNHIIIKETGCTNHVQVACGAKEALTYLDRSTGSGDCPAPDLIFLDINMPGMNGWEFLAMYKELNTGQKTKIVMLSASINPDDEAKAHTYPEIAGLAGKPCTNEMIRKILTRHFPEQA